MLVSASMTSEERTLGVDVTCYLLPSAHMSLATCCLRRRCHCHQLPSALGFPPPAAFGAGGKLTPLGQSDLTVHCWREADMKKVTMHIIPYDGYLIVIHHHICNVLVTTVVIAITIAVLHKAVCCSSSDTCSSFCSHNQQWLKNEDWRGCL
jgi:hypothetical protein